MSTWLLKSISLSLALLVLQSSTGILVDMHFCKGKFKTFALYKKAKSCHALPAKSNKKCLHHLKANGHLPESFDVKKHNCCENSAFFNKNDIEVTQPGFDEQPIQTSFLSIVLPSFIPYTTFVESSKTPIPKRVKPPPLGRTLRILHQSFLF